MQDYFSVSVSVSGSCVTLFESPKVHHTVNHLECVLSVYYKQADCLELYLLPVICLYKANKVDSKSMAVGQDEVLGWFRGCVVGRNIISKV